MCTIRTFSKNDGNGVLCAVCDGVGSARCGHSLWVLRARCGDCSVRSCARRKAVEVCVWDVSEEFEVCIAD